MTVITAKGKLLICPSITINTFWTQRTIRDGLFASVILVILWEERKKLTNSVRRRLRTVLTDFKRLGVLDRTCRLFSVPTLKCRTVFFGFSTLPTVPAFT